MKQKFHVRFHLGAGIHYKHWQVKHSNGDRVYYYNPNETCLILQNCRLVNMQGTANRVFSKQVRDVCGWIECNSFITMPPETFAQNAQNLFELTYDPKIRPHWYCGVTNDIIDNCVFSTLITNGRRVYTTAVELGINLK